LPAVIDLDGLEPVRESLSAALESGSVRVSGAAVERVATNGLFLLMSAAETARRGGVSFLIEAPSAALIVAIDRLGLGERFAGFMKG
jgi:anti-anti-sigma regulatory factor